MRAIGVAAVAILLCAVARGQNCGNGSIALSGSSSVLTLASPPKLSFDGDFTVECWAKLTTVASNSVAFILVNRFNNAAYVYVSTSGSRIFAGTKGSNDINASFSISVGQWYHYAMTRAGSVVSVFINGAPVGQTATSAVLGTNSTVLRIGGHIGTFLPWQGAIANFRVVKGSAMYT